MKIKITLIVLFHRMDNFVMHGLYPKLNVLITLFYKYAIFVIGLIVYTSLTNHWLTIKLLEPLQSVSMEGLSHILLEAERVIVQSFFGEVVSEKQHRVLHDHFKDDI